MTNTHDVATDAVPQWTLGDRLRKARTWRGIDRADMAEALGATLRPDAFVLPRMFPAANGRTVAFDPAGGVPRPVGWLTLAWSRHAKKMGAPDVRLHDLRHFNATELLDAGVPIKTVQNRLGHRQTKTTTDIYGHGTDAADTAAAEVLLLRRRGAPRLTRGGESS